MRALLCGDGRRETEGWHGAGGGLVAIENGVGAETSGTPVDREERRRPVSKTNRKKKRGREGDREKDGERDDVLNGCYL
jgi:hypothetical protein